MASTQTFRGVNHGFQVGNNFGPIDNVNINTVYSNEQVDQLCLRTLRCPDLFAVKNRLKENKDKLVYASIEWIFQDPRYIGWQDGEETGLLWIKGSAGKGKTMMSIGLIERLLLGRNGSCVVTYFFCQDADYELNTLESIIKGLILQLINQQEGLKVSLRRRWDTVNSRFEADISSWRVLWDILLEMLNNCKCQRVYVLVDALDECRDTGMADFLKLIVRTDLHQISKIKWLLTSRPLESSAERELLTWDDQVQVTLELHSQQFSEAIRTYIASKVAELNRRHRYPDELRKKIETILNDKSEGTFLWVSLACKRLENVHRDETLDAIQQLPPGLRSFYDRMYDQLGLGEKDDRKRCMELLNVMMLVYQPLQVVEVESLTGFTDEYWEIEALVGKCASFITMRGTFIEFNHQSARDYLAGEKSPSALLDSHEQLGHGEIALRCLAYLSERLKVNLCNLPRPNSTRKSIEEAEDKEPAALLSRLNYAAIFWPQHLESGKQSTVVQNALGEHGAADEFLRARLLEWLECLSLLDKLEVALEGLQAIKNTAENVPSVAILAQDATRFLLRHYYTIANWLLQIYSSGIIFSPEKSIVRGRNMGKTPLWIKNVPRMESVWSSLIQTLSGHSSLVRDLAFSPNSKYIASGSQDTTIKLWDATTGNLQRTLGGHSKPVVAVRFSSDGKILPSGSHDKTVKLWNTMTENIQKTLRGHSDGVCAVAFSPNGKYIASGCGEGNINLWDTTTGNLQMKLEGHLHGIDTLAFSPDGKYITSGCMNGNFNLWDTTTGDLQKTLRICGELVTTMAISPNGKFISSKSGNKRPVQIWDATTSDLQTTLGEHSESVHTAVFSSDGKSIALLSIDGTIKLCDTRTGDIQKTLSCQIFSRALAISPQGKHIALGSGAGPIEIWDTVIDDLQETLEGHLYNATAVFSPADREGHFGGVLTVIFSPDGKRIASGSYDRTVKLWDATTGNLQITLKGHSREITTLAFSPDGKYIASGSNDKTIKLWNITTGGLQETLEGSVGELTALAISPDCSYIASASASRDLHFTIHIWDVTGVVPITTEDFSTWWFSPNFIFKEIQTQELVHTLKFSADGRSLKTNLGLVRLESYHTENDNSPLEILDGLCIREQWILYGDLPILRLPFDFEPVCHDVLGDRVAIGCRNGRVLGFMIDRTRLQALLDN
ncbi:hypothetical protein N7486_000572 [Penicillium sp. IBT 16267x]|nr:hypothetical protein N7486_000572 [Penicillium sp. IBT 16267x]